MRNQPLVRPCPSRVAAALAGLGLLLGAAPTLAAEASPEPGSPSAPAKVAAPAFDAVVQPPSPPLGVVPLPRPVPFPAAGPPLPTRRRAACDTPEPMREGFYLRIAQGMGYASFRGTGPGGPISASGLGSHSTLAIGGGLTRGLAIAGTLQSTDVEADFKGGPFADVSISAGGTTLSASRRAELSFGQIGALVDWYPQALGGFHGGLSAGFGAVALTNNADDSQLAGFASSGSLFVGYDTVISRTWGFGLALVVSGVTTASLKNTDGDDTGYKLKAYAIGLAGSLLYF